MWLKAKRFGLYSTLFDCSASLIVSCLLDILITDGNSRFFITVLLESLRNIGIIDATIIIPFILFRSLAFLCYFQLSFMDGNSNSYVTVIAEEKESWNKECILQEVYQGVLKNKKKRIRGSSFGLGNLSIEHF